MLTLEQRLNMLKHLVYTRLVSLFSGMFGKSIGSYDRTFPIKFGVCVADDGGVPRRK